MITRRALLRAGAALGLGLAVFPPVAEGDPLPLVAQGDSLTRGSTPAYPVVSYAAILAQRLGRPLWQQAFNGSTLATQAPAWLESPPGMTVSLCGYNDMRLGTDLALYELALSGAALTARQRGPVFLGGCLRMTAQGYAGYGPYTHGSDAAVAAYNQVIAQVAARAGAIYVDMSAYDPYTLGAGDEVHPSAEGQTWIADRFMAALGRVYLPAAMRPSAYP